MTLVALYMNCAVDKTTGTGTGQTTYINHTNNYIIKVTITF